MQILSVGLQFTVFKFIPKSKYDTMNNCDLYFHGYTAVLTDQFKVVGKSNLWTTKSLNGQKVDALN